MKTENEITDATPVASVNALAAIAGEGNQQTLNTTGKLSALLAEIVGDPTTRAEIMDPNGKPCPHRTLPNILCGHSGCTVRVLRGNGLSAVLRFPSTVGELDKALYDLGKRKTADEEELDAFEAKLMDTLDAYGHLTWTVGNEDWIACADASLGRHKGKLYLAWHVVVDCESGGFTDTLESGFVEITPDGKPPLGILAQWLDICWEHYAHDQDGGKDPDKEHLQIDSEGSALAIKGFDEHIRTLWNDDPSDPKHITIDGDEDEEPEEPFDSVAWGWVGSDGLP